MHVWHCIQLLSMAVELDCTVIQENLRPTMLEGFLEIIEQKHLAELRWMDMSVLRILVREITPILVEGWAVVITILI